MSVLELTIKASYVPDWGIDEAVREFLQNAMDEQDHHGHTMKVKHVPTPAGRPSVQPYLEIKNTGGFLDPKALLLGETDKVGVEGMRGRFAEGLKLGLLAAARAGYGVEILTSEHRMCPFVEASRVKEFAGAEVLKVRVTGHKRPESHGVVVRVHGIDWEKWAPMKRNFRFLEKPNNAFEVDTWRGTVLLAPVEKGRIYAKGIFVHQSDSFKVGYDLKSIQVDRDRKMVDHESVKWETSSVLIEATAKHPEIMGGRLYAMLQEGADDVENVSYREGTDAQKVGDLVLEAFTKEHGKGTVPVANESERQEVAHLGRQAAIVPPALKRMIEKRGVSLSQLRTSAFDEVVRVYDLDELSDGEGRALARAQKLVLDHYHLDASSVEVRIVDFRMPSLNGVHSTQGPGQYLVRIARKMLQGSLGELVVTLCHEVSHEAGADLTDAHVKAVESLLGAIIQSLLPKDVGEPTRRIVLPPAPDRPVVDADDLPELDETLPF